MEVQQDRERMEPFFKGFPAATHFNADSDESGHLFQSISDTIPILSDSCRSEATL